MVTVNVDAAESATMQVDWSGGQNDWGRQGFRIKLGGAEVEFEDEQDAERLAKMILDRLDVQHLIG